MPPNPGSVTIRIGTEHFTARLRHDLAPRSCEQLTALLPYSGNVIHARWSGEALWSPLAEALPLNTRLPVENANSTPVAGDILLYTGSVSEPELLIVYGTSRFACNAGSISGNPVLKITDGLERLAQLGRKILWHGAKGIYVESCT